MSESEEAGLMAEGKYGRLFTEMDALGLVAGAFEAGVAAGQANPHLDTDEIAANYPGILELLARRPFALTFPADEPLFLLRGQDTCAIPTIAAYQWQIEDEDAPVTHRAAVEIARCEFVRWQHENPD